MRTVVYCSASSQGEAIACGWPLDQTGREHTHTDTRGGLVRYRTGDGRMRLTCDIVQVLEAVAATIGESKVVFALARWPDTLPP